MKLGSVGRLKIARELSVEVLSLSPDLLRTQQPRGRMSHDVVKGHAATKIDPKIDFSKKIDSKKSIPRSIFITKSITKPITKLIAQSTILADSVFHIRTSFRKCSTSRFMRMMLFNSVIP